MQHGRDTDQLADALQTFAAASLRWLRGVMEGNN